MNLYESKQLAASMRVVRKNTIAIAEDIPEAQYDYRPTPDSRSGKNPFLFPDTILPRLECVRCPEEAERV